MRPGLLHLRLWPWLRLLLHLRPRLLYLWLRSWLRLRLRLGPRRLILRLRPGLRLWLRSRLYLRLRPRRLARRGLRRRLRPRSHVSWAGGGRSISRGCLDRRSAGTAGLESSGMTRTAGLARYAGGGWLGRRVARSAGLKLSGSTRSTWLYLARPSGNAGLEGARLSWTARLHLARPDTGLHRPGVRSYARLDLTRSGAGLHHASRAAGLHLAGPAGYPGLWLSGSSRGPGGYRLPRQGGSHRLDPLVRRQLLNLGVLLRGQLHGGPGR